MSVAAGINPLKVCVDRACRPGLVTATPPSAGNSRVGDASCERDADTAVLDWNNPITKTEPAPGETVIDQANSRRTALPSDISQVVLVLQGGGAFGAYQIGVYQALHDADIEPDWIIGTSIGAINASLIAGNAAADRLSRMREF